MGNCCRKNSHDSLATKKSETCMNTYSEDLAANDEREEHWSNPFPGNSATTDENEEQSVSTYPGQSLEAVTNRHTYDYILDDILVSSSNDDQHEDTGRLQFSRKQNLSYKTSTALSEIKGELPVGQPYVTESNNSDRIELQWSTPRPLKDDEAFNISYKEDNGKWKAYDKSSKDEMLTIRGLKSKTNYFFRVRIVNDNTGEEGPFSAVSNVVQTGESPALRLLQKSSLMQKSIPPVYTLPIEEDQKARNVKAKTRKFTLGNSKGTESKAERTIMIVGATGSGKSTLINAIANYVVGVTWEDSFRFTLVNLEQKERQKQGDQAQSQTEWVTCYTIYQSECSRIGYTINLIDTPGFGDTRGFDQDKHIVHQIRELFSSKGRAGVDTIDAVCFIVKAPDSRLTITQKYIFDSILALFGNDIQENICTLITFADGQPPPVLAGIQALEGVPLPYEQYFTFNNSALFVKNEGNPQGSLSPMFWEMGIQSFDNFFRHVQTFNTKSLTLTAEVLNKRHSLQNKIHNLQIAVTSGMGKICTLEDEIKIFTKYKDAIKDNVDFEYEVEEQEQKRIDISGSGQHTTTCITCNYTCHEYCQIPLNENKRNCVAMKDGKCTECPKYCSWESHLNTPYVMKFIIVKKKKNYEEKLKKYEEASKQKLTQEQVMDEMKQDIIELDKTIQILLKVITDLNNRLTKIALRPDPMSAVEYIELMIDNEQREKRNGYRSRIDAFQRCKDAAKYGEKVQIFQARFQRTQNVITTEQIDKASEDEGALKSLMKKLKSFIPTTK